MISWVGLHVLEFAKNTWDLSLLFYATLRALGKQLVTLRFRYRETMDQMYSIAVESLPIIVFSLTFTTLMLITEFSYHMKLVLRQDTLVPAFSTVLMLRELGPMLTCLLLTSRVGAGIAAEIGSMKVTEQLDALELLSIDRVDYLTVPRWLASVFAAVTLSVTALGVSIAGGASIAAVKLGYSIHEYFNTMFLFARPYDFWCCVAKAFVFGSLIPLVACHHGFQCRPGSEGVGTAATSAVVQGSVLIIVADFVLTYLLYAV